MKFGAGRPAAAVEIYEISPLSEADLANFKPAKEVENIVKKLRDSHHRIAHLYAMGFRPGEVAEITGYSLARLSNLRRAPAFDQLVEQYRKEVNPTRQAKADHQYELMIRSRALSLGEVVDRLEDDDDRAKMSTRELLAIYSDLADRTGYPKRTVAVNINADFATRLDMAIERSQKIKTIEGEVIDTPKAAPRGNGVGSVYNGALQAPTSLPRRKFA